MILVAQDGRGGKVAQLGMLGGDGGRGGEERLEWDLVEERER